ncbi:MAG: hypothetical protein ACREBS_00270 [Nitrososphaerales archaeon]
MKQESQQLTLFASVTTNLRKYLPNLKKIALLAIFYAGLSFAYSMIGFLHPEIGSHYHEYLAPRLLIEIAGHFSFGFIAAIPFLDLELSLLIAAGAVLIDTDHILSALNLNVSGRPDHSFFFVFVSAAILIWMAVRFGFVKSFLIKMLYFAPVVVFSHISYDIFTAPGSSFQLLIPFSFESLTLPYYYWIIFETAALILSYTAHLSSRRWGQRSKANVESRQRFAQKIQSYLEVHTHNCPKKDIFPKFGTSSTRRMTS